MKKFYLLIMLLCGLLTACSLEDILGGDPEPEPEPTPEMTEVTFKALIDQPTRVTETAFDDGDAIGVFAVEPSDNISLEPTGNYAENVKYIYNGSLFQANSKPISFDDSYEDGLAYYAVYPYSHSASSNYEFSVKQDQSVAVNYAASDLCTAYREPTTDDTVLLHFNHALSNVEIKFSGNSLDDKNISVRLLDMYTTCSVDINAKTYTAKDDKTEVVMKEGLDNTFNAIVVPQTVDKDAPFVSLTIDGVEHILTMGSTTEFKSGKKIVKEYEVKRDDTIVEIRGEILPWDVVGDDDQDEEDPDPTTEGPITLEVDRDTIELGESVEFTVWQEGVDVTNLSAIYFDAGYGFETVYDATFTPEAAGTYQFFATKGAESSPYVAVTVTADNSGFPVDSDPSNTKFNHRVMILDHTGVHCGYCPLVTTCLHELEKKADVKKHYNEVTCHGGGFAGTSDPGWSSAAAKIDAYTPDVTGYPHVQINMYGGRITTYSNATAFENTIRSSFNNLIQTDGADVGIAMNVVVDAQTVYVSASIKAAKNNEYKAVAWLLENNIYSPNQANYGQSYDYHYIYNHAVRNISGNYSSSNVFGDSIGTLVKGETINTTFELPITSNKWVVDNMEVIVIVTAKNAQGKWEVVNTAVCPVNDGIGFEYL